MGYSLRKVLYTVWVCAALKGMIFELFWAKIGINFNQLLTESGKIGTKFRGKGSLFQKSRKVFGPKKDFQTHFLVGGSFLYKLASYVSPSCEVLNFLAFKILLKIEFLTINVVLIK